MLWPLGACTSGSEEPSGEAREVVFTADGTTRAALTDGATLLQYPFAVYGDMASLESGKDNSIALMCEGEKVTYNASAGQWGYDDPMYWFSGFEYSFTAIQPVSSPNLSDFHYLENQLDFTYTQPGDYKDADDVLVSTHRRRYTGGSTSPVSFRFSHALANLKLTMSYIDPTESETATLNVTGLTFRNVPTEGRFAISPASLSSVGYMTDDWTHPASSADGWEILSRGDVSIKFPADGAGARKSANDETARPIFTGDDALLLLPNPEAGTELTLSYVIEDGKGGTRPEQSFTAVIPAGWSRGKTCVLALSVNNKQVNIKINVAEWNPTDPEDVTVPRK